MITDHAKFIHKRIIGKTKPVKKEENLCKYVQKMYVLKVELSSMLCGYRILLMIYIFVMGEGGTDFVT